MFRIGEKVVCVDDFGIRDVIKNTPIKGNIYTIKGDAPFLNPDTLESGVYLVEISNDELLLSTSEGIKTAEPAFLSRRFRRLVDQKKIEELLTTAPKETENV